MGIGNTSSAAAICATMTGTDPARVTGRGAGLDDAGLVRKVAVIRRGLELHKPDPANPLGVLSAVGGFEIGFLAGLMLGLAERRVAIALDGFIVTSAALIAHALHPRVVDYIFACHLSVEPGHRVALERLGLTPLLDLNLGLGEGSGAALGMTIIDAAARLHAGMATFDEAAVSGRTDPSVMSAITAAIRFLTVVPAPGGEWSARAASRSVAWFPAVGLGIGGAVAAVHWAARLAMPDLPAAALALAAGVILTGALHLDGLADTFDGLLGGDTPKRRLEIMKDPSIGVFGVAAVVLVLIAKWGGLSSLPDAYGWAAIAVAAMSGRFAAVASMAIFRYERSQGLGSPFVGASRVAYLAAAVFAAALAFVLAGPFGLAALACATVVGLAVSAFAARQLNGGVTGDVYGAAIELAEVSALLAFVAMFSAGLAVSPVWSG